eukprot:Sspe_Gene.42328::Locus_20554_Transcript_1_1_Confidence_1.000_Length_2676::g.42328::m.42328
MTGWRPVAFSRGATGERKGESSRKAFRCFRGIPCTASRALRAGAPSTRMCEGMTFAHRTFPAAITPHPTRADGSSPSTTQMSGSGMISLSSTTVPETPFSCRTSSTSTRTASDGATTVTTAPSRAAQTAEAPQPPMTTTRHGAAWVSTQSRTALPAASTIAVRKGGAWAASLTVSYTVSTSVSFLNASTIVSPSRGGFPCSSWYQHGQHSPCEQYPGRQRIRRRASNAPCFSIAESTSVGKCDEYGGRSNSTREEVGGAPLRSNMASLCCASSSTAVARSTCSRSWTPVSAAKRLFSSGVASVTRASSFKMASKRRHGSSSSHGEQYPFDWMWGRVGLRRGESWGGSVAGGCGG